MKREYILLIGEEKDLHIHQLLSAIEQKKELARIFDPTNYCTRYRSSMSLDDCGAYAGKIRFEDGFQLGSDQVKSVWRKHMIYPDVPDFVADEDRQYVREENWIHMGTLMASFAPTALQANPWRAYFLVENKLLQLTQAKRSGLIVPETLISNSAEDIRSFIRLQHAAGRQVVCKSSSSRNWHEGEVIVAQSTVIIEEEDLPSDRMMGVTPMIFQSRVEAQFELRVTVFGHQVTAVRIHSDSDLDWRVSQHKDTFHVEPYSLPESVRKSIISLFDKLGLVTGSIDLMVNKKGEYVFLEVNESGQFLWIEWVNPQIPMLDMVTDFLISGDPEFTYSAPPVPRVRLETQREDVHAC